MYNLCPEVWQKIWHISGCIRLVSFPDPLAIESGSVERSPWGHPIGLWSRFSRRKVDCNHWVGHIFRIWHTKITNFNWKNKSLFFIEDAIVTFLSFPPFWDTLFPPFGTRFIKCISLDPHFHICLAQRSRLQSLLSDQFLHFVIVF